MWRKRRPVSTLRLLGEMEAKTRELIARRTTPVLEYIKNRKLEKQRIREEKRLRTEEERVRKVCVCGKSSRLREEEKEEERCKTKKKIAEKEVRVKVTRRQC